MAVFVANESGTAVDEAALVELSRFVLRELGIDPLAELSVLLVDIDSMTQLHERWMGESGPTDVLAFPMDELARQADFAADSGMDGPTPPALLGDVVLCPEVAADQAREHGHATDDELHLLATHGVLHLLGFDHGEPEEEREMFARQQALLLSWQAARTR
ncbi:MAG: rRNA maturation RNase YbeY [Mycobacteriales bacterium]